MCKNRRQLPKVRRIVKDTCPLPHIIGTLNPLSKASNTLRMMIDTFFEHRLKMQMFKDLVRSEGIKLAFIDIHIRLFSLPTLNLVKLSTNNISLRFWTN